MHLSIEAAVTPVKMITVLASVWAALTSVPVATTLMEHAPEVIVPAVYLVDPQTPSVLKQVVCVSVLGMNVHVAPYPILTSDALVETASAVLP
ncbi:hypothetical protein E2C01_024031 [Portunus trituberculatus]|uniref:Uncharacterized protein n=1 Tax=Portunus trituberculatus TaxID=210409 RepID=A0A5B7E9K9_PORTR|nr:hypothetical protein [Portunus trituberculatus]